MNISSLILWDSYFVSLMRKVTKTRAYPLSEPLSMFTCRVFTSFSHLGSIATIRYLLPPQGLTGQLYNVHVLGCIPAKFL